MIKDQPFVSILIPVFNSLPYIREAMDSIFNQTYINFEVVIINDGSNDGTEQILRNYASKHQSIKLIEQENHGYCAALNCGIEYCSGKYVARMDSDDIMHPQRIELQVKFMEENPDVSILGSAIQYIDENGNLGRCHYYPKSTSISSMIFDESPVAHPSSFMRKDLFLQIGKYRANLYPAEDYDLWLRAFSANIKIENLQKILLFYRVHNKNTSLNNLSRRAYASICAQRACQLRLNNLEDQLDGVDVMSGSYFDLLPVNLRPSEMEIFCLVNSSIANIELPKVLKEYNSIRFQNEDAQFRILFLLRVAFHQFMNFKVISGISYFILSLFISPKMTILISIDKFSSRKRFRISNS